MPTAEESPRLRASDPRAALDAEMRGSPSRADREYYALHLPRFVHTLERLRALRPAPATVLDVGSHFLHQAAILREAGYDLHALDVPAFAEMELVCGRAARLGIANRAVEPAALAAGAFGDGLEGAVDVLLFTEILEHVTFNPVRFWRRVHELLRVGGFIYVTTPNAFALLPWLGTLRGALTRRRAGLPVEAILHHVTYGHHWKEFSAHEIRRYFQLLSPDFRVAVRPFHYAGQPSPFPPTAAGRAKEALRRFGNRTGALAEQLEAVVVLERRTPWATPEPSSM